MIEKQKWKVILEMLWPVCYNFEIDQKIKKYKNNKMSK